MFVFRATAQFFNSRFLGERSLVRRAICAYMREAKSFGRSSIQNIWALHDCFTRAGFLLGAGLAPTELPRVAAWGLNLLPSATLKKDFQHECCPNKGHPLSILPRNASRSKKLLINEWAISAFDPTQSIDRLTKVDSYRTPRAEQADRRFHAHL